MYEFKIGEYEKSIDSNRVFKVCGFTDGRSMVIPPGWLLDYDGFAVNPAFFKKYEGAISVINGVK